MKAFTDIEQSMKLAEILPPESADMCYRIVAYNPNGTQEYQPYCFVKTLESDIPCYSLAALLNILPETIEDKWGEYDLTINMIYKKPEYIRLGDCHHGDFPSWDWDNEELLDNIVEAVIWLNNNNFLQNETEIY